MSAAIVLFLSRVALLVLLYGFLYIVVRALRRDLRSVARGTPMTVQNDANAIPARGQAPRQDVPLRTAGAAPAAVAPTPPGLGLEVVEGGQTALARGARFALRDPFLIGRSATNDLALEDDWVSAQHVRLRRQNGTWVVEDVGSTNGTNVNDRRLSGLTRLRTGDRLQIGRVILSVVDNL